MNNITNFLENIKRLGGRVLPPATPEQIKNLKELFGSVPKDLEDFYLYANGVELNSWVILPIYDQNQIKKTWDSIQRANTLQHTKFSILPLMLNDFLIFSQISGLKCVVYHKKNQKIWFETNNDYVETDLTLGDFIQITIQEESDSLRII